jgi:ferredoxin-NADP reductase
VLAAGGIGITALVAMGRALKARGADYRFVYGARSRKLMAFLDDLTAEHGDRLEVNVDDEDNRLDVKALVDSCPRDAEMYVCGPIPMLDAIRAA